MTGKRLMLDNILDPGRDSQSETHSKELGEMKHGEGQLTLIPEVLEQILKHVDVIRQKLCRLVSRKFNEEVCRIFNSRGVVVPLYGEEMIPVFKEVYRRSREMSPDLPNIFANTGLRLEADSGNIVDFYNLPLECPELKVTELTLWGYKDDELPVSREYLELIAPSLIKLEACRWNIFPDCSDIQFPILRELRITSDYSEAWGIAFDELYWMKKVDFWRSIIEQSPRLLHLICKDMRLARELFESCDMAGIRTLSLKRNPMEGANNDTCGVLMAANIQHLTKLSLNCELRGIQIPHLVNNIIARYSSSLNSLQLWGNADSVKDMPLCPSLCHLTLKTLDIESFNWRQVPKLRSVLVKRLVGSGVAEGNKALSPCLSVEKVWLGGSSEETVEWAVLFKLFPRATHWKLGHLSVLPGFCEVAGACNANIQILGLVPSVWGKELLPNNLDLPSCLQQLKHLSELEFVSDIHNTLSPFSFSLKELPNIKILRWQMPIFGLKASPHYTELPKILASLQRVELIQFTKPSWDAEMEQLVRMLPGAVPIQKLIVYLEPDFH